ncbi:MAG: metallophosphoesterase [Actinomycetaceae bacterium]|nr:metallophosphoesterase [Actinomycetaceae bacterium]
MIFLTGDTHGATDIHKLTAKRFDRKGLTRDDYVIILGDFGLIWEEPPTKEDAWWLDWLENGAPWTTLVVLGNHENYRLIRKMETEAWKGGRMRRFRPHVLQLVDNEIFDIEGQTFFVRGGAHSIDRHRRIPGKSWWPEEVPTVEERSAAISKLDSVGWKVDYVLTHEAPTQVHERLYPSQVITDEYARWLQTIANRLEFRRWYFGHHHQDVSVECHPPDFVAQSYEEWLSSTKCYCGLYRYVSELKA